MRKRVFKATGVAGFSLIELMVVLSIVSTMTAMGAIGQRKFLYQAIQTEAKLSSRVIYTLMTSWRGNSDRDFSIPSSDCPAGGFVYAGYWDICYLVWDDPVNCTLPNNIGFKVTNCAKNRYDFYVAAPITNPERWRVDVELQVGTVGNNAFGADIWEHNSCGQLCQGAAILNVMTGAVGAPLAGNTCPDLQTLINCK